MENAWGSSDKWEYPEHWHLKEDLLDASWDVEPNEAVETTMLQVTRKLDWIDHARRRGDPTALNYYDTLENVGIVSTVTYHDTEPKIAAMPDRGKRKEKSLAQHQTEDYSYSTGLPPNERRGNGGGSGIQKATMGPRP